MSRRKPPPVEDRRTGSPAEQMRVDLEGFRAAGVPFDRAWKLAYERCKWPHHTGPKQEWKAILAAQRHQWRMAYDRQAPSVPVEATAKLRAA